VACGYVRTALFTGHAKGIQHSFLIVRARRIISLRPAQLPTRIPVFRSLYFSRRAQEQCRHQQSGQPTLFMISTSPYSRLILTVIGFQTESARDRLTSSVPLELSSGHEH
jgi:hypothetical protein